MEKVAHYRKLTDVKKNCWYQKEGLIIYRLFSFSASSYNIQLSNARLTKE